MLRVVRISNIFAALFIIFKVPTKLFSDLYPVKFQIPRQNRSFLVPFLQFSHLAPNFTLDALPRKLSYVERAKFLRGEMPCVTLGPI